MSSFVAILCRWRQGTPGGAGMKFKNLLKSERTVSHKREKKKTRRIKRVAKDI
jgi:hypothetical protein